MSTIATDSLDDRLAERVAEERRARGWSVADLAERSGVSRAMIAKIEGGDAKPTASLLGKLSVAFGLPLSLLFARVEAKPSRVVRAAERRWWTDPETRYRRRPISPPHDQMLQLVEVEFPPGARVSYPADAYTFVHQQVWVLEGRLTFREGSEIHELAAGDCLTLGPPADCVFENRTRRTCRYVVAVARS